jgi:hypothetical protein
MKTFWLLMLIVNCISVFTYLVAIDTTGNMWYALGALGAACLAGFCHHKLDRIGP